MPHAVEPNPQFQPTRGIVVMLEGTMASMVSGVQKVQKQSYFSAMLQPLSPSFNIWGSCKDRLGCGMSNSRADRSTFSLVFAQPLW